MSGLSLPCGALASACWGRPLAFSSPLSGADAPGKMPQVWPLAAPVLAGQHGFDEIQIYEVIKIINYLAPSTFHWLHP